MEEKDKLKIRPFDGRENDDFQLWTLRIESFLEGCGLADQIRQVAVHLSPGDEGYEKFLLNSKKAKAIMVQALGDRALRSVQTARSPLEMWTKLQQRYAAQTNCSKISILSGLMNKRYKPGTDMSDHVAELESDVNRLAAMNCVINEDLQVAILITSVSEVSSFSSTVAAIKTMRSSDATWAYISSRLIEESKQFGASGVNTVPSNNGSLAAAKKLICYRCGRAGHKAKVCHAKRKVDGTPLNDKKVEQRTKPLLKHTPRLAMLCSQGRKNKESMEGVVSLDSAASEHVTNDRSLLTNIKPVESFQIEIADGRVVEAHEQGELILKMKDQKGKVLGSLLLRKVYYIKDIELSLISVSRLDEHGITSVFSSGHAKLLDRLENHSLLGVGKCSKNGLFEFYTRSSPNRLCSVKDKNECLNVWHNRLGHANTQLIESMIKENRYGMKLNDKTILQSCTVCNEAKQSKEPTTGMLIKETEEHVLHVDILGPIYPLSAGGAQYVLSVIVEKSRYAVTRLQKLRSECIENLREIILWLERKTNITVKRVHFDGAKEFKKAARSLTKIGIEVTYSSPYTPQSNGCVERFNRTLGEKTRSLLIQASCPQELWGEAILHATELYNKTITRRKMITPHEILHGFAPDMRHFRVFGCSAFQFIPKQKRDGKFSKRSQECILLSHKNGIYKLMNISTGRITNTKNVKFSESEFPFRRKKEADFRYGEIDEEDLYDFLPVFSNNIHQGGGECQDPNYFLPPDDNDERHDVKMAENTPSENTQLRRSTRTRKQTKRIYAAAAKAVNSKDEPKLRDAMRSPDAAKWKEAISHELKALEEKGTFEIIDRPVNEPVLHNKWVLKLKRTVGGKIDKYKARLVICGNEEEVDSLATFSPVADFTVIRLLLCICVQQKQVVVQVDGKSAFLNSPVFRIIYMELPKQHPLYSKEKVCLLKKSLYGLKDAPRLWFIFLSKILVNLNFIRLKHAPSVFRRGELSIVIYVDDMLMFSSQMESINTAIAEIKRAVKIEEEFKVTHYLGVDIHIGPDYVELKQSKNIKALIQEITFTSLRHVHSPLDPGTDYSSKGAEAKGSDFPYRALIGSLLYLSTRTRPDLAVGCSILGQHCEHPSEVHIRGVKRMLQYLKCTQEQGYYMRPGTSTALSAYADASFAGEKGVSRRSRSGYAIFYGNALIAYKSILQRCVATSSTEAEYIALSEVAQAVVWLRNLLEELGIPQKATAVWQDNEGSVSWASDDDGKEFSKRRHVDVRYHYVRSLVQEQKLSVRKIAARNMRADFLTKVLGPAELQEALIQVGMRVSERKEAC